MSVPLYFVIGPVKRTEHDALASEQVRIDAGPRSEEAETMSLKSEELAFNPGIGERVPFPVYSVPYTYTLPSLFVASLRPSVVNN